LALLRTIATAGLWALILGIPFSCGPEEPQETLSFEQVTGFVIGANGTKYLSTENGLFLFDTSRPSYDPVPGGLPEELVNDLAFSGSTQEGDLWLAMGRGACNHSRGEWLTKANSGLQSDQVTRLHFDPGAGSYFSHPQGLSILRNAQWIHYTGREGLYQQFEITDIGTASDGYTYVTTRGGGVERLRAGLDGISGATLFDANWSGLLTDEVYTVYIADTLQVYGTCLGVAFHSSEYTKWDWVQYTTLDGLVSDTVQAVLRDTAGSWWFGTPRGISRFDGARWTTFTSDTDGLVSDQVKFLALDTDGSVWMASDQGVARFDRTRWTAYPKTY
jgi:ligand-binding sensor domain-containing protein